MMVAARGTKGKELPNMGAESRSAGWEHAGWNIDGGS